MVILDQYIMLKKFLICLLISFCSYRLKAQVVEVMEGYFVDCKNVSGTLEVNVCSLHSLQQAEAALDTLYDYLLVQIDSAIIEDDTLKNQLRGRVDDEHISFMTDYRKIKKWMIESQRLFLKRLDLETAIAGEMIGNGRARTAYANSARESLIRARIERIRSFLEQYFMLPEE